MSQTIKFGKMRAKADPDRDFTNHGIYYGMNVNRRGPVFIPKNTFYKTTRAVWVARIKH
jgi:hypothetical protein